MNEEGVLNAIFRAQENDGHEGLLAPQLQVPIDQLHELLAYQLDDLQQRDDDADSDASDASDASTSAFEPVEPQEPVQEAEPIRLSYPDDSIPLKDTSASKQSTCGDFLLAFAIWCIIFDVSRVQYMALLQVLKLLPKGPRDLVDALESLPGTIETMKSQATSRLPLFEIRSKNVPLNTEKLPTLRREVAESNARAIASDANATDANAPDANTTDANVTISENLYFFNPVCLFERILSSSMVSRMHFGMAVLVDSPTSFWHSSSWAQSIRATSGEFARIPSGKPIFPSDFVRYRCAYDQPCVCKSSHDTASNKLHWGRIRHVWKEGRAGSEPSIKIDIQPVVPLKDIMNSARVAQNNLSDTDRRTRGFPQMPFNEVCEYVVISEPFDRVPEGNVADLTPPQIICLDLSYGSSVSLQEDSYIDPSSITWPKIVIRQSFNVQTMTFTPLCKTDPIAGELEIKTYGREWLEETFAGVLPVRTIPTTIFNDGFGLYRSMHKSIEGIYIFLTNLQPAESNWQVNVFPLTLGPHGSNPNDVVDAIRPYWATLEEGINMSINGKKNVVCAFNLAFRADMPQQQDNSGMLRQLANRGCRDCDVSKVERGLISEKWTQPPHRRSHHEVQRQRSFMETKPTKREKALYGTTIGMASEPSPLVRWSPAMDIIRTRPSDAAHSEYAGITKMTHLLLIDQV